MLTTKEVVEISKQAGFSDIETIIGKRFMFFLEPLDSSFQEQVIIGSVVSFLVERINIGGREGKRFKLVLDTNFTDHETGNHFQLLKRWNLDPHTDQSQWRGSFVNPDNGIRNKSFGGELHFL